MQTGKIALIDYGAGNLTSVRKGFAAVGADVFVPTDPTTIADAAAVVVPGVGHFGATRALGAEWIDAILERLGEGRPILGICLGMQWLFEGSEEAPDCSGLGLLGGRCYRLGGAVGLKPDATDEPGMDVRLEPDATEERRRADAGDGGPIVKVPHVGWNAIEPLRDAAIAEGIPRGAQVYFTHSFVAPVTGDTVAVAKHGEPFSAIVQRGQVVGVQFHPEKSGEVGLRILSNFLQLAGLQD